VDYLICSSTFLTLYRTVLWSGYPSEFILMVMVVVIVNIVLGGREDSDFPI